MPQWASELEKRTWGIESAGGLGYLLSQQLIAAGETVLDVPASLAAGCVFSGRGSREITTRTTPYR